MSKFPPLRLREAVRLGGLSVRELAVRTWHKSNENEIMTRAAAVAFYAMLALVPLLGVFVIIAVGLLPDVADRTGQTRGVGDLTVGQLESTLRGFFPHEAYAVIEQEIARLQHDPPVGFVSVGVLITIWLASSLFVAVMDALNRIYHVRETRSFVKIRLTAIGMTIVQSLILVAALVVLVAWPAAAGRIGLGRVAIAAATLVQWTGLTFTVLMSFALTFYVAPDAEQRWEWITPGSVIGTAAFLAVSMLFRIYVQNFAHYGRTYGSLGGVMVLLFWFWLSTVVLLGAGQINQIIEDASPLGRTGRPGIDPSAAPEVEPPSLATQGEHRTA